MTEGQLAAQSVQKLVMTTSCNWKEEKKKEVRYSYGQHDREASHNIPMARSLSGMHLELEHYLVHPFIMLRNTRKVWVR